MNGLVIAAFLLSAALSPIGAPQETAALASARDLYASARYEEALTVLNALGTGEGADRKSIEQYRSLCLLALGRAAEAEAAIAAVVTADPIYQPSAAEASPRVRGAFTEVRRRLLPRIVLERYVEAKSSYDRQDWPVAEEQFHLVLSLVNDPDMEGRLSDLRVLAGGFVELSARAAAPGNEPIGNRSSGVTADAERVRDEPLAAVPDKQATAIDALPGKLYGPGDEGVTPPTIIKQDVPAVPKLLVDSARQRGAIEVVIDEQGRVVSMAMRESIHQAYDQHLLVAASGWRYKPATINGQPVKFRKVISIVINP